MPLRVTFIITDLHRGGSPLWLAALAPGLLRRGMDVDVVSLAPEGEVASILRQRGVWVTSLNAVDAADMTIVPRLVRHLRKRAPQVVCSVLIHANLVAALARPFVGVPMAWVQSIHTLQERPRWHWYVQGVLCWFADAFVAPSRAVVKRLERFGPVPRAMVIPNGIDVARFRDAVAMPVSQRPWPADALVVGYVGRFDPVKRIPVLLGALPAIVASEGAHDAPIHLALVGYGTQEMELRRLAVELGVHERVHFVGASAVPERWYKTFAMFCSPSPAEGFGLTLAEARAAGIPVIACRTDAVVETLGDAVWLPEACTEADVGNAILRVAGDLARGIRSAQSTVYREAQMIDAYNEWLASLGAGKAL